MYDDYAFGAGTLQFGTREVEPWTPEGPAPMAKVLTWLRMAQATLRAHVADLPDNTARRRPSHELGRTPAHPLDRRLDDHARRLPRRRDQPPPQPALGRRPLALRAARPRRGVCAARSARQRVEQHDDRGPDEGEEQRPGAHRGGVEPAAAGPSRSRKAASGARHEASIAARATWPDHHATLPSAASRSGSVGPDLGASLAIAGQVCWRTLPPPQAPRHDRALEPFHGVAGSRSSSARAWSKSPRTVRTSTR